MEHETASDEPPVMVADPLMRALKQAGITSPADGRRLSKEQLDKLLVGKSIEDRIALKRFAAADGVYPL